jgi:hypothetical protein
MPKNIVLLSDGTGNSAGQLLKTNVWRIYESLDLDDPNRQVACYDDGVGTSTFKPLALLGGAIGVGLKRNVLRLYRFLCEHYDPGDRIYAFGFSRGAFTIRVLVGLIANEGIIRTRPTSPAVEAYPAGDATAAAAEAHASGTPDALLRTEPQIFGQDLKRLARWAYRSYRAERFTQTGGLVTVARRLRNAFLHVIERRHKRYDPDKNHKLADNEITFLGLWDTVDAYGLPVDELTDGINKWLWPLSVPNHALSPKVRRACHVLAIDDERNTFHPVLWDEIDEPQDMAHVRDERISQVWFAGMHSNVGGGYADDSLSCVSLRWIMDEAENVENPGLLFNRLRAMHIARADPFGRVYDSRSGLKSYYRYNPRRIDWLTNGQQHETGVDRTELRRHNRGTDPFPMVSIGRVKIHESVFARIAAAPEAYAPIIFPERYAIVREDGSILDASQSPYEDPNVRPRRVAAQEALWDLVWHRRVLYFATVAATIVLLVGAFLPGADATTLPPADQSATSRVLAHVGGMIPLVGERLANYYSRHALRLYVLLAAIGVLMLASSKVQATLRDRMRGIWSQVVPPPGRRLDALKLPKGLVYTIRSNRLGLRVGSFVRRTLTPAVFGLGLLISLTFTSLALANRLLFEAANIAGGICSAGSGAAGAPTTLAAGASKRLSWAGDGSDVPFLFCYPTGILVEKNAHYQIRVEFTGLRDRTIPIVSPAGVGDIGPGSRVLFAAMTPFRRVWSADWGVPVARIGTAGFDEYPLERPTNLLRARSSGPLLLFLNDAIAPVGPGGWGWMSYYFNNSGTATFTITRLVPPPGSVGSSGPLP